MPFAIAARTLATMDENYVGSTREKEIYTVSMMPEALGLPSTRTGFPSMYFDSLESRGSRDGLKTRAAAIFCFSKEKKAGAHKQAAPLAKPAWNNSKR